MPEVSETFKHLKEDPQGGSQHLLSLLETFFFPLLLQLDDLLDKRLVRTFVQCLVAIIRGRNNTQVLWLSELGSYLDGYGEEACSAAAGTKRVGKLLRSIKWSVDLIERYLLEKADKEVQKLKEQGKRILCIWDDSVVEKAESEKGEGLAPVLSSKAKRRGRTRRGVVFNWPALRPVRVVGMQWSAALIVGMQGLPHLALSRWWSTKGVFATTLRAAQEEAFRVCCRKWGPSVVHIFDRGYASANWLLLLLKYHARFVVRWIKRHEFLTVAGERKKLWQIGQGKKYRAHKEIRDTNTGQKMPCDLWWTPLRHPLSDHLLYMVKARVNKGVMYLITNEGVQTEEQAWEIFFSYRRRWQIETSFRYGKCELALECPRLWSLDARLKLLGMVMLIYTFLLSLLDPIHSELVQALLRFKCHRTGKRCQNVLAPLYRLRWALSRLWDDYRPRLSCFIPPSDDLRSVTSFLCSLEQLQKNWG